VTVTPYRWRQARPTPQLAGSSAPSAADCRKLAAQHLGQVDEETLELGALQIYENSIAGVGQKPQQMNLNPRPVGHHAQYLAGLAALAGTPGFLPLAIARGLKDFHLDQLWPQEGPGLSTFSSPQRLDQVASQLAPKYELSWNDHQVMVTGVTTEPEREKIAESLEELRQAVGSKAFSQLKSVHVRPYLAHSGASSRVSGLFAHELPGEFFVSQLQLGLPGRELAHTVHHEFGHLMDSSKAGKWSETYASVGWSSPFGNGGELDYVSGYAQTKPWEDCAETHAYWVEHKAKIQAAPQMWIHANGKLGEKLAWLSEHFYAQPTPAIGTHTSKALQDIRAGKAPFESFDDFQEQLQKFLHKWDPQQPDVYSKESEAEVYLAKMAIQSLSDQPAPGLLQRLLSWPSRLFS
jgi:hypothetical protein